MPLLTDFSRITFQFKLDLALGSYHFLGMGGPKYSGSHKCLERKIEKNSGS